MVVGRQVGAVGVVGFGLCEVLSRLGVNGFLNSYRDVQCIRHRFQAVQVVIAVGYAVTDSGFSGRFEH